MIENIKKLSKQLLFVTILFSVFVAIQSTTVNTPVYAVSNTVQAPCSEPMQSVLGIPTWYKYLKFERIEGRCSPVISQAEAILPIGLAILEALLTFAGVVAVLMIMVGAFKYIITLGEPDKAKDARSTIINTLIGLAIVMLASAAVSFIGGRLR